MPEVLDARAVLVAPEARERAAPAAGAPAIAFATAAPWRPADSQWPLSSVAAEEGVVEGGGVAGRVDVRERACARTSSVGIAVERQARAGEPAEVRAHADRRRST